MKKSFLILSMSFTIFFSMGFKFSSAPVKLALLKYGGGGDWYANPSALTNLSTFCNKELKMSLDPQYATVEVGSAEIFNYPFVHMTGHGNVVFNDMEAQNLRQYLMAGGFLHIDDNYGMDPFVRPAMKKVFPELDFFELPFSHDVYSKKACQKFISTMRNHHRVLDFSGKEDLFVFIHLNATLATVGRIERFIKILRK
jgi:Domain of unknown function (DUF4159)